VKLDAPHPYAALRRERLAALWTRHRAAEPKAATHDGATLDARRGLMTAAVNAGASLAHNALEAADLNLDDAFEPRPAATPTHARPGSPEKIAVLEARAAAGEALFHPDDATYWTHAGTLSAADRQPQP
jgi:hypothetical protein